MVGGVHGRGACMVGCVHGWGACVVGLCMAGGYAW